MHPASGAHADSPGAVWSQEVVVSSGWLIPALQEGRYTHTMNEGFFTPPQGLCGLWHLVDVLPQCEKDKDQMGQASQGKAATGPGDKLSRHPQSLRAGPVGAVQGKPRLQGPACRSALCVGRGAHSSSSRPPGSLPCPESCWGRRRGVPRGP